MIFTYSLTRHQVKMVQLDRLQPIPNLEGTIPELAQAGINTVLSIAGSSGGGNQGWEIPVLPTL